MNKTFQSYQIDLLSNNNFAQYNTIQGDGNDIRGFEVELIENNKPYIITDDVEVFIAGTKPDTKQIFNSCDITEEGKILVNVTSQMSAITGRGDYQIILISKTNNQQLKTFPFIIYVKKAAFDAEIITSSDEFNALTGMVNKIESTLNKTDLVDNMLESSSKILDDTITAYDNAVKSLEKAQDAIETAESINSTAQESADNAKQSEENSLLYSNLSKSYAVGTNDEIRESDSTDNAKYYKEQAELNSASALQSANLASQKAENASLAETNAQQYALNAAGSETNAKISEENAKNSEDNALQSSSDAMQSAAESENSAKAALESATNASISESSAKSYAESAAESANRAEQVSLVSLATQEIAGIVKPDGTTITVDEDGTLHGANTIEVDGQTIEKTDANVLKIADALKNLIDNSVQKVAGKDLSANNFTDVLLNKLNSIEQGAQVNPVPVNNLLTIVPGTPLDAVQGKALGDLIGDEISRIEENMADLRDMDDDLEDQIDNLSDGILNRVYPVGSVYISFNNNSPANFIGGTWERLVDKFLYAATNNISGTGGEASHTLSVNELPSHTHSIPSLSGNTNSSGNHAHKYGSSKDLAAPGSNHGTAFQAEGYITSESGAHTHTVTTIESTTGGTGNGNSFSIMPPYIKVYMWRRID